MTIRKTIEKLRSLKELSKEAIKNEGEEMSLIAVDAADIEALTIAETALEGIRILDGIFSREAEE